MKNAFEQTDQLGFGASFLYEHISFDDSVKNLLGKKKWNQILIKLHIYIRNSGKYNINSNSNENNQSNNKISKWKTRKKCYEQK